MAFAGVVSAPSIKLQVSPNAYVQARNGHFFLGDERIRFWGFNIQSGAFPEYNDITHVVERLAKLGMNAVRLWPTAGTFYDIHSTSLQQFVGSTMGDGSTLDRYDFFVAELKRNGIFIQNPALHYVDVDTIRRWPDPEIRTALGPKASPDDIRKLHGIAPYLLDGWERMLATHIRNYLLRINPYTQRPYADDTVFSGWELANESQFVHCALRKSCVSALPPVVREALKSHWRLHQMKFGSKFEADLPIFDADWDQANPPIHAEYRKFVFDRFVTVSKRLEVVARGAAPYGKGVAVQPITYSTQAGDPLLLARAAHAAGDYSALGAYQTPLDPNKASPFYPFRLNLASPVFYNFNYGAVAGKPTTVYENSFFRPYPYRVEWPWSMLFLAVRQDWDALFLYSYGQPWAGYEKNLSGIPIYGIKALPIPSNSVDSAPHGAYHGLHHGGDEVVVSSWSAAGSAFLSGQLSHGLTTKFYRFGPDQIFGLASGYCPDMGGCKPGGSLSISVMNGDSLIRPIRLALPNGLLGALNPDDTGKPNDKSLSAAFMKLDSSLPRLTIDGATTMAVAGVLEGEVNFSSGYSIYFPHRQFGFVSLSAADGLSVSVSNRLRIQSASGSSNSGFLFDPEKVDARSSTGVVRGVVSSGTAPIMFKRLDFKVSLPRKFGHLTRYDFNFETYGTASSVNMFGVEASEPFFLGELSN